MRTRTSPLRVLMLGVTLATSFVLSSCAAAEPDKTPLPVLTSDELPAPGSAEGIEIPVRSDPPQSEEEAIHFASQAIDALYEVEAEVFNSHPEDTSMLAQVASPEIVQGFDVLAQEQVASKMSRSGFLEFIADDSRTVFGNDGPEVSTRERWSLIGFHGCVEMNGIVFSNTDGTDYPVEGSTPYWIGVQYRSEDSTWIVVEMVTQPPDGVTC